jgi:hypothetical protein
VVLLEIMATLGKMEPRVQMEQMLYNMENTVDVVGMAETVGTDLLDNMVHKRLVWDNVAVMEVMVAMREMVATVAMAEMDIEEQMPNMEVLGKEEKTGLIYLSR